MNIKDITFVVLTRDEAHNIGDCLDSIPHGSPAIVYDAESSDATRRIAAARGAVVATAPWRGFVEARNAAAGLVATGWTFMLDADERLSEPLREELSSLQTPAEVVAFSVPRRNVFCGRWIRGAGWWPDRLVRLFRTGRATLRARPGAVHERWEPDGRALELASPLIHASYPSIAEYQAKFAAYTSLEASSREASLGSMLAVWLAWPARFWWLYLGKLGAADGWRGLYISAASAAYPAVVETKAWRRSS